VWHYPKNSLLPSKLQVVLTHSRVIELGWFLEGFLNIRSCQQKMTQALRAPNVTPFPAKHSNVDTWFHIIPCVDHVSLFWNTCPHIKKLRLITIITILRILHISSPAPSDGSSRHTLFESWPCAFLISLIKSRRGGQSLECCEIQHQHINSSTLDDPRTSETASSRQATEHVSA